MHHWLESSWNEPFCLTQERHWDGWENFQSYLQQSMGQNARAISRDHFTKNMFFLGEKEKNAFTDLLCNLGRRALPKGQALWTGHLQQKGICWEETRCQKRCRGQQGVRPVPRLRKRECQGYRRQAWGNKIVAYKNQLGIQQNVQRNAVLSAFQLP